MLEYKPAALSQGMGQTANSFDGKNSGTPICVPLLYLVRKQSVTEAFGFGRDRSKLEFWAGDFFNWKFLTHMDDETSGRAEEVDQGIEVALAKMEVL